MSELPLRASDANPSVRGRYTGPRAPADARSAAVHDRDAQAPLSNPIPAEYARTTGLRQVPTADLRALPALLTVAETAEVLRVGRTWVYEHAAELGAVKLGPGQTAPLRIPSDGVRRMVGLPPAIPERRSVPAERHRESTAPTAELRARPRL